MLKQSARFGVRSTSIMLSFRFRYSRMSAPTGASAASSIMPSLSSLISSSDAEHSIPNDSTWRSFAFLILKSPPSTAPIFANGILMPGRAFGAPHTTWNCSVPSETVHTCSLSALGCCSAARISPTTTPVNTPAAASTSSTSRPANVT